MQKRAAIFTAALLAGAFTTSAQAQQGAAPFFKDKQLTLAIGSSMKDGCGEFFRILQLMQFEKQNAIRFCLTKTMTLRLDTVSCVQPWRLN